MKKKAILKCGDNEIYPVMSANTILVKAGENNFILNDLLVRMGNDIQLIKEHLGLDNIEENEKKLPKVLFQSDSKYAMHGSDDSMFGCTILANDYENTKVYYKVYCDAISGIGLVCSISDDENYELTTECKAHVNGILKNVPLTINNNGNGFELTNTVIWFMLIPQQIGHSFVTVELCNLKTDEVLATGHIDITVGVNEYEVLDYAIAPITPIETIESIREEYLAEVNKINNFISTINNLFYGQNYIILINNVSNDATAVISSANFIKYAFVENAFADRFNHANQMLIDLLNARIDTMLNNFDEVVAQFQEEYDKEESNTFEFLDECEEFIQECDARVEYDNEKIVYSFVTDGPNDFISNNLESFKALATIMNTVRKNLSNMHSNKMNTGKYTSNSEKIEEGYGIINSLHELKKII